MTLNEAKRINKQFQDDITAPMHHNTYFNTMQMQTWVFCNYFNSISLSFALQITLRLLWKSTCQDFPRSGSCALRSVRVWSARGCWERRWPEGKSSHSWTRTAKPTSTGCRPCSVSPDKKTAYPGAGTYPQISLFFMPITVRKHRPAKIPRNVLCAYLCLLNLAISKFNCFSRSKLFSLQWVD